MRVNGNTLVTMTVNVLIVSFKLALNEELYVSLNLIIL